MYIKELKDISVEFINKTVEMIVLISEINVKTSRNGKKYADITIQDNSKMMEAKYWDYEENEEKIQAFDENEIVEIEAIVGEYNGQLQITIRKIEKATRDNYNIKDFIPTSDWDTDVLDKGLKYYYSKIESTHMRELVERMIFAKDFYKDFFVYPAARRVHHNFYHGLLQHTLEVLKYAYTVATTKKLTQRQVDRLIVMTMLHDWGKILEYKALPQVGFTDEGTMLGHIFMGAHHTLNKINEIDNFPEEDKLVILNGILGHHGFLEFGSPVLPKTVEAQILHQSDKMSGDVESILSFIEEDTNDTETFTGKLWNMGTEYYKK